MERMWKEAIISYLEVLSLLHFLEETEKTRRKFSQDSHQAKTQTCGQNMSLRG